MSEVKPGGMDLPAPIGIAPPITSDPPFHALARRLLLPAFGPKRIAALEPFTRELCRELLDDIGREGRDPAFARSVGPDQRDVDRRRGLGQGLIAPAAPAE